jgi:hypothetical protein
VDYGGQILLPLERRRGDPFVSHRARRRGRAPPRSTRSHGSG